MRISIALAMLVPLAGTVGCVMPDQVAEMQKDVADVQAQLTGVAKSQKAIDEKLAALEAKVGSGDTVKRSDIADLQARIDEVVRQSTAASDKADQIGVRVDRLSQDVELARESARRFAPSSAVPGTGTDASGLPAGAAVAAGAAAGAIPNPNALYTSAYADFSKGNYPLAVQGFAEYAERFPQTELADNALYWIGECHFSQGSYKNAIESFDKMLETYPASDKAAAANLKKALAFVQMNQIGQGVEQLRYVVATYPGSDEARIAKDRLTALGKP